MPAWDIPSTLLNCWGWYTADTLGLANGATLAGWADRSGNGRNLATTAGVTYQTNALNAKPVVNIVDGGHLRTPAVTASLNAASTLVTVWKFTSAGEPIWDNTAGYWYSSCTTAPNGFYALRASSNQVGGGNSWHCGTIRHTPNATPNTTWPGCANTCYISVDDCDVVCENARNGPTPGNLLELPRSGSLQIAELAIFDRPLMQVELYEIHRYLAAKWGLWWPGADAGSTCILWQGNSTTRYSGGVASPFFQTDRSMRLIQDSLAIDGTNSVDAYRQRDQIEQIASYWKVRGIPSILVWHHGHNDSSAWNIDVISDPNGSLQRFRRAGGCVMIHTMSQWAARDDSDRQTLNTWIRNNWQTVADGFYDLGGSAEFGVWDNGSAPAGTSRGDFPSYWADQVHPTLAGQQAKAALVGPSLKAMLGRVSLTSNVSGAVTLTHSGVPAGWSYQWYRATTAFNPLDSSTRGSALSGATSQTLTDTTVAANTLYSYSCLLTHATEGSAWSSPYAITSKGGGASPARIFGGL